MPGFHFNEMGELVVEAVDDIAVVDVYDLATDIGKEYERIIDRLGAEAVKDLMPKIINTLELLEALATKNEQENATIQDLRDKIAQLESEKMEKEAFRRRFDKELELIEEQWRTETNDLANLVSSLQDENKRLVKQTQDLQASSIESSGLGESLTESIISVTNNELNSSLTNNQVLQKLKEQIYKQKDDIKEKDRELLEKQKELEHMTIQLERLKSTGRDNRRRCTVLQSQVKTFCEERVDFLAQIQEQFREINTLRKRLGLAEKENEDLVMCQNDSANDHNKPCCSANELKELINERDKLLNTIENLNEELKSLKLTATFTDDGNEDEINENPNGNEAAESECSEDNTESQSAYDAPVQGPLPYEPDDAPWKKQESGIRKFFRRLFADNSKDRSQQQGFPKHSIATFTRMTLRVSSSSNTNTTNSNIN